MNLLRDPWLPFQKRDGHTEYLPITSMTSPEVVDLALPRADFQGAAYQFLIGLLQTAFAPENADVWMDRYEAPPSEGELAETLDAFAEGFQLEDGGPCFMQDYESLEEEPVNSIAGLLIDSPGASTIQNNTDHFVKEGRAEAICPECAAIALFTMQINAPSGGKGYRTGLRGGGPLTTLLMPASTTSTLWEKLWINVLKRDQLDGEQAFQADPQVFPWMEPTRTSEKGQQVLPTHVHPLHVYWAMPRRYRLAFDDREASCDLCGRQGSRMVTGLRARNYGNNYGGPWVHPLTPYRKDPKKPQEPPLSIKGQPGGIGYRHWEGLVFSDEKREGNLPAANVEDYPRKADECEAEDVVLPRVARLWAFGYDMDNMKPRGWVGTQLPFLAMPESHQERMQSWLRVMTGYASEVCRQLKRSTKEAWFKRPSDAKGDLDYIDSRFWERTEQQFYDALSELGSHLLDDDIERMPKALAQSWYLYVRKQALTIFDDLTLGGPPETLNLKRITQARNGFTGWFGKNKTARNFRKLAGMDSLAEESRSSGSRQTVTDKEQP